MDASTRAMKSIEVGVKHAKKDHGMLAVAAGLRALTWAVLHVGEQLKRQADFWEGPPRQ